tara:strand:- start:70 stop:609 length:540 start_codon:yes stop_codon:yes gene_type:complete
MNSSAIITFDIFTIEQIKEINKEIKKNIFQKEESSTSAQHASKIGEFSHVFIGPVMDVLHPWLHQCQNINREIFGYDMYWDFHLDALNYNVYGKNGEYTWHIDLNKKKSPIDMKLTCLLNLSEESYEGGEFYTINSNEKHEFTSGMGLVFNSLIAHKVTPITNGERITLIYLAKGPSWK